MEDRHLTRIDGQEIDLWPYAEEALRRCPYKTDLTTSELITVIELEIRRKYINVAWQDRVEGRNLYWPIQWVMTRMRRFTFDWTSRFAQMADPDIQKMRPYLSLVSDIETCERADQMRYRWLRFDELKPLPLLSCDRVRCFCTYRTLSSRDILKGEERRTAQSPNTSPIE